MLRNKSLPIIEEALKFTPMPLDITPEMIEEAKKTSIYYKEAKEEGLQEGALSTSREIAKRMLQKDIEFEIIQEITGLSIDELMALKQ